MEIENNIIKDKLDSSFNIAAAYSKYVKCNNDWKKHFIDDPRLLNLIENHFKSILNSKDILKQEAFEKYNSTVTSAIINISDTINNYKNLNSLDNDIKTQKELEK